MKSEQHQIEELKASLEKEHGRPFSLEEATEAQRGMETLVQIVADIIYREVERKQKLTKFPKGFHLEDSGTCGICNTPVSRETSWYDEHGIKCIHCQHAIDKKLIPLSVIKNKESWYSKIELELYFNFKWADLNRFVKQGILKKRTIPHEGKNVHFELYLIKENKGVLPPKKILKSRTVKMMKDGEEYYTQQYWYEFIDMKGLQRLQKYKIIDCLKETLAKPIKSGHFYFKQINPLFTLKK